MNEASFSKRVFALATVAMTILWSVGAFVAPLLANAQVSLSEGDLIKGESFSTVYYFDGDARWTFPDEGTFFSWYTGFGSVVEISDAQLAGISLAGNVVRRPGTRWVKIQSDPATYAVTPDGSLRWIETEEVAVELYGGSGWNTFIDDVHDTTFADYSLGASLMSADSLYDGALVSSGSNTYLVWDGATRMVSSAGMSANGLQSKHVMNTNVDVSALPAGDDLDGYSAEVSDTIQMAEGDGEVAASGSLSVSLASNTPAGVTVPAGANGVEVVSWRFTAGDAATLNSLVVDMEGVSSTSNIANVYLYEGKQRLTEGRSVNSATREATFSNLGLDFSAGQSRTFTLRMESNSSITSGQTVAFSIEEMDAVVSGGSVSGSFPLTGNLFTFSSESAGTVTVYKSGTITNPQIGEQDATIGKFRIEAATEAAWCEYFRIEVDNASDHSDFKLWQNGDLLGNGVSVGSDGVAFDMEAAPFEIGEGDDAIFELTADVGGDNADNVKVFFDRDTDVICAGGDFGFNMQVDRGDNSGSGTYDGTSCTTTAGNCSFSTLEGGDITFTYNGPSASDLPIDSQDQVFLEFALTTATDITIDTFPIRVGSDDGDGDEDVFDGTGDSTTDNEGLIRQTTEANLKDIKVIDVDSGLTVMGPLELSTSGDDALQTLQFTEDVFVSGGTTMNLAVTADIDNNMPTTAGDNLYGVAIDVDSTGATFRIEDTNGDAVSASDISPSTDLNGSVFTMESPDLTIALASSPASGSRTFVQGAQGVDMVGFTFDAQAEDITVTSVLVSAYGDDTNGSGMTAGGAAGFEVEDYIASCSLYDGEDNLLDGPVAPSNSGADFNFDDMDWTIPAEAVELMIVTCNFQNPSDTDADAFAMNIDASSTDVTAQDEDGSDVSTDDTDVNGDTDGAGNATTYVTINASGTLAIASSSSTPDPMILMAGTSDNFVSAFRFTATNEDFMVKTLTVTEHQGPTDDVTSSAANYSNNIAAIDLQYPDQSGVTQTATAFMSSNLAKFGNLNFYVPSSSSKTVNVFVDVPEIDRNSGGSATSGEKIKLALTDNGGSTDQYYRAVGQGSQTVLDGGDFTGTSGNNIIPTEAAHVVRETMPTVQLHASSPGGASVPGNKEAFRFSVSAGSGEDVVISQITFRVSTGSSTTEGNGSTAWDECDTDTSGSGLDGANWTLYNSSDLSNPLEGSDSDWSPLKATAAACDATDAKVGFVRLRFATESDRIVIDKGTTETFQLWANTTGASTTADDTIQIDIPSDPILTGTTDWLDPVILADGGETSLATAITTDGSASAITHGDLVCFAATASTCLTTEEIGLVTNVDDDTNTELYVYRGYLGRDQLAVADNDELPRLPSAFVWQDDGDQDDDTDNFEDEVAGAYLVDALPIIGDVLVY